jgi:hypothetical protein
MESVKLICTLLYIPKCTISVQHMVIQNMECGTYDINPFNTGIKSLRATLPDEIFYWGFFFLNRAFR